MHKRFVKSTVFIAAMIFAFSLSNTEVKAETRSGEGIGGMGELFSQYYDEDSDTSMTVTTSLLSTPVTIPGNIAIANCNNSINIRSKGSVSANIVGKLEKNGSCIIQGPEKDGWVKVKSGDVAGYVSTDYLYMGQDGFKKAEELAKLKATVTANGVKVRNYPSTTSNDNIIAEVSKGENLIVVDNQMMEVVTKNDPKATIWVKVVIDDQEGYVTKDYVSLNYKWKEATKVDSCVATNSSLRSSLVTEAKKHVGLRYSWGGTSLTKGADCSGFVWATYTKCGLSVKKLGLPRSSSEMSQSGKKVTMSTIQPGDLVFYGKSSGRVDHVAMYIGNGKVIHESGHSAGCKISNINYRKVLRMRNYLD